MATTQNRASLIAASIGLTVIALIGAGPATSASPPSHSIASVQEDDPGFDCLTMGNLYCGDPEHTYATEAWAAWDKTQAWKQLQVAATDTRVEYVGYAKRHPNVDLSTELAVPARHGWFVFRGTVTTTIEGK